MCQAKNQQEPQMPQMSRVLIIIQDNESVNAQEGYELKLYLKCLNRMV
jgi:hypothetical protein